MRILHIIGSLEMGGAENLLIPLTAEQKRQGNDVSILLLKKAVNPTVTEKIVSNDIDVSWLIEKGSLYNPMLIIKLRPYLKKYDIVHVHLFPSLYWTGFARWLTNGASPLIYTEHSTKNRRRNNPILRKVDNLVYRNFYSHVIACSEKARETFLDAYPGINHITTVNNGVDTRLNREAQAYTKQELLGISEDSFVITMVARFMFMKRQDTIVEAISKLPTKFHACFVGGDKEDEGLMKIAKMAEDLCVSDRVHFLYSRPDVPRILKTSDVVMMSSEYEGLSLSSIEGMAAGKPFLATNVNGLREVVEGAGELFELNDSGQLSSILLNLESNHDYYKLLANRCNKRASEFDVSLMAVKYMEVYKNVLTYE